HADDEPEGLKELDLDEDEEVAPATNVGAALDAARASTSDAPTPAAPKRRKKKENKGEATEADLAALDSTDWDEVKAEVDALRQRIGSMGAVNLVAIEEYSELKQRYE